MSKKTLRSFVSHSIAAIALGAAAMVPMAVEAKTYTTLDWIQGKTDAYIKSGYTPKSTDKIEVSLSFNSTSSTYGIFCARGSQTTTTSFTMFLISQKLRIDHGNGTGAQTTSTFTPENNKKYVVVADGNTREFLVDGTSYATMYEETFTPGSEMIFLASWTGGASPYNYATDVKLYGVRIWNASGTLMCDFVPATDGTKYGLFNRENMTFHASSGTADITSYGEASDPETYTLNEWQGGDDTNPTDWNTAGNWSGGVPSAGDNVVIPSGIANMPVLAASTPTLGNVVIEGTLTMTNWSTRLKAATVRIASGGILTCAGPFTDTEMSNRVWVACTDFTLLSGGKVDVTDKGYGKPTDVPIAAGAAWGPGKALGKKNGGAHGGYGGGGWSGDGTIYDSVEEPVAPGSTGRTLNGTAYAKGIPAGGAVRIDATGIVTINGTITANGHESDSGNNSGAGSGGSILIHANRIVANGGSVEANGGNAGDYTYAAPAGGGRIALHYDASAETEEDLVKLSVSASGGRCYRGWGTVYPIAQADHKGSADIGTIWFSDTKPLSFLGTSLTGQIYLGSGASYSCDSITMTNGWVRFAQEGFELTVAGDVTVSGTRARLEVGGGTYYRDFYEWWYSQDVAWIGSYHHLRSGTTPWVFTVGGDLTVTDGARLDLYAAATNGTEAAGGTLAVTGDLTVAADSKLYLSCDAMNGGAPLVTADNVSIAQSAIVSADYRGFALAYGPANSRGASGTATGANSDSAIGAGHGGAGNKANASNGQAFDDATRPSLPGAGGNYRYEGGSEPLSGGGVVHLVAANAMTVNGMVCANAYTNIAYGANGRSVGGAGGTVLLEAKTFAMGNTASVLANGSGLKSSGTTFHNAGCGGGGRIAVWTGKPYVVGETTARQLTVTDVKPAGLLGTFSVEGGYFTDSNGNYRKYDGSTYLATSEKSEATVRGEDGTIRFVTVSPLGGLVLIVR